MLVGVRASSCGGDLDNVPQSLQMEVNDARWSGRGAGRERGRFFPLSIWERAYCPMTELQDDKRCEFVAITEACSAMERSFVARYPRSR